MGKKIVLLEFADEAECFLNYCRTQALSPNDFYVIALQPGVQVYLKKLNITYENTLPYFSTNEHKKVLLKSEEWYKLLADEARIEGGDEIKETYNNTFLFYVRFYAHHFLMYVEMLSSICRRYEVESIHTCIYQNKIRANNTPHIQKDERYVGLIAREFAKRRGIVCKEILAASKSESSDSTLPALNWIKKNLENSISAVYKSLMLSLNRNKKVVLLTSTGYNIENFAEKLKTEFPETAWIAVSRDKPSIASLKFAYFRVLKLIKNPKGCSITPLSLESFTTADKIDIESRRKLEGNLDRVIEKLQLQKQNFDYEEVNFLEVFIEKIQRDLKPYILSFYNDLVALREILESFNVKLYISPLARELALLGGELCQKKGIPALMISHGTLKKPENEMEEIEYRHMGESLVLSKFFNYVAMQTPNEEKVCRHYQCKNTLVKTGPLIFSRVDIESKEEYKNAILGKVDSKTRILVYPENTRLRAGMRFHVFETFDEFLSSAADLVNAINEIENAHLVIRLHPGREITPEEFKLLLPPSNKLTVISHKRPFFEILTIADLILNFSSTVIEDALQNHIPVVLYDKRNRYMHLEAEKMGGNRRPNIGAVYYINDPTCLKEGIEYIMENHLDKDVPKSIFEKYAFQEDYFNNFLEFFDSKVNK